MTALAARAVRDDDSANPAFAKGRLSHHGAYMGERGTAAVFATFERARERRFGCGAGSAADVDTAAMFSDCCGTTAAARSSRSAANQY
jgi:hypothetical protein